MCSGQQGACTCGQPPWPGRHTPRRHTPERGGTPSRAALLPRPLTPTSRAAQDLTFVVELAAVPGKDEEILDILEAEAEEARAKEAAAKAKEAEAPAA